MTRLYLLEPDHHDPVWTPFGGVRPVAELRAGAWLIRERWEATTGHEATAILCDLLAGFADTTHPPVHAAALAEGPGWVVRSDIVPERFRLETPGSRCHLICDGAVAGWWLEEGERWAGPATPQGEALPIAGMVLGGAWDLITALERFLPADAEEFTRASGDPIPGGSIVLGDPGLVVLLDALVEPGVVFDTRHGAVVLAEGSTVRSGTRLEGPLIAGPGTVLLGGSIRHSSFGPQCRVQGEVATSVLVGFANKSHDGFLGHSVLGPWVNFGAGTITSNLKNTYGPIRLDLPGGRLETGRAFLGSLVADHAKTAIGTLLGAGTVIGAGANVFGAPPVPRHVAPFAWGFSGDQLDETGFLRTAERVMPRRGIEVTPDRLASLRALRHRATR
jgi:UDP-N-acetylglucosamine diphosphorylase/glucosamine-1-phosphate N-acetyltransferase